MKSRLLNIVLLLLVLAPQARADNLGYTKDNPLIFGIDMDYPPMEYVDADGMPHGFDVEFTKRLMKRLNIPFTYSPNTWENIAGDVLHGKVDLGIMVYSSYRKNETNYSRAVFRLYYQIVFRTADKGKRDFGLRNVKGKEIAFMDSRPVRDTLSNAGAKLHIVKDLSKAMKELSQGKYDAVICFRYQATYNIETYGLKGLETEDLTLMSREYCYVSHDKQLIDAINVELEEMDADGTIDEVYGNVRAKFGGLRIPMWVWLFVAAVIIFALLSVIFIQRRARKRLQAEMERAQKSEQLKDIFLGIYSNPVERK